ncbi:MAG: hypothetical protein ABI954_08035 [Pyrinomonadaceae bacterium]
MAPLGLERGKRGSAADHQTIKSYYNKINQLDDATQQRDLALEQQRRMQEMFVKTGQLLQNELGGRRDLSLRKVAQALLRNTVETSQGLALLSGDSAHLRALVTPDNKAFAPDGQQLSGGSSVILLNKVTGAAPEKVLALIADRFDADTARRAAKAYGDEIFPLIARSCSTSHCKRCLPTGIFHFVFTR